MTTARRLIIIGIGQTTTATHQTLQTPMGRTVFWVEDGVVDRLGAGQGRDATRGLPPPPMHRFFLLLLWATKQLRHQSGGVVVRRVWDCRDRGWFDDNTTLAIWPPAQGIAAVLLPALEVQMGHSVQRSVVAMTAHLDVGGERQDVTEGHQWVQSHQHRADGVVGLLDGIPRPACEHKRATGAMSQT